MAAAHTIYLYGTVELPSQPRQAITMFLKDRLTSKDEQKVSSAEVVF